MTSIHHDLCRCLSRISSGQLPDGLPPDILCREELSGVVKRDSALSGEIARLQSDAEMMRDDLQKLRLQEHIYRSVFEHAIMGIMIVSPEGKIIDANQAIGYMLGYQIEELKELSISDIALPEDNEIDNEMQQDVIEGRRIYYQTEKRYVRNEGILFWGMVTVYAVRDKSGAPILVNMLEDISASKSVVLQLEQESTHDSLTGLYNRTYFDMEYNRLQYGMLLPVSIIVIDVDGLKIINDTQGHEAGDRLIISVATILKESFRGDDTVARVGGDEFTMLLPETGDDALVVVVDRLRRCQARFNEACPDFQVNFSIGSATAIKGNDIPQALKLADERMYAEKILNKATRAAQALSQQQ